MPKPLKPFEHLLKHAKANPYADPEDYMINVSKGLGGSGSRLVKAAAKHKASAAAMPKGLGHTTHVKQKRPKAAGVKKPVAKKKAPARKRKSGYKVNLHTKKDLVEIAQQHNKAVMIKAPSKMSKKALRDRLHIMGLTKY